MYSLLISTRVCKRSCTFFDKDSTATSSRSITRHNVSRVCTVRNSEISLSLETCLCNLPLSQKYRTPIDDTRADLRVWKDLFLCLGKSWWMTHTWSKEVSLRKTYLQIQWDILQEECHTTLSVVGSVVQLISVVKSQQSQCSALVVNFRVFPSGISTDIPLFMNNQDNSFSLLVLHVPVRQVQDFTSTSSHLVVSISSSCYFLGLMCVYYNG